MSKTIFKIITILIVIGFSQTVFAIGIEEVMCAPVKNSGINEYVVVSGISITDICFVTDLSNKTRKDSDIIKTQVAGGIKLDLNTTSFLNNTGEEEFTVTCGEAHVKASYEGGKCQKENLLILENVGGDTSTGSQDGGEEETEDEEEEPIKKTKEVPIYYKLSTNIPKILFSGINYSFEATIRKGGGTYSKEIIKNSGYFLWNFGDGAFLEFDKNTPAMHTYSSPGKYVLVFEYYADFFSYIERKSPTLSSRFTVEVLPKAINISSVNFDGSVEIENPSDKEFDISLWILKYADQSFRFPSGSIILPQNTIVVSDLTSDLGIMPNRGEVVLLSPNEEIVSVWKYASPRSAVNSVGESNLNIGDSQSETETVLQEEVLGYQLANVEKMGKDTNKNLILWLFMVGTIALAIVAVIFRRRSVEAE